MTGGHLVEGDGLPNGVGGRITLKQRVPLQLLLDIRRGLDIGVLQQLDRLTQLRRHDQSLALAEVETWGYRHGRRLSVG